MSLYPYGKIYNDVLLYISFQLFVWESIGSVTEIYHVSIYTVKLVNTVNQRLIYCVVDGLDLRK